MADYAARRTNMVDTQVRPSDVTKYPIIEAMLSVPKESFLPDHLREIAYLSENIVIGDDRVVLEPRTMAKMLDALNIQPGDAVLDLGCGLGYSSAVIAHLAEAVVAVESIAELAEEAQTRLSEAGADNVAVITAELADGDAKHGPYDVIVIQGGIEVIGATLLDQLRDGGLIAAIFVDGVGTCKIGHKSGDNTNWRFAFNASAPLLPGFARAAAFAL